MSVYAESVPKTFKFHIGDLITVTSGRMVSPRGRKGLCEIVEYMAGRSRPSGLLYRLGVDGEFLPDAERCKLALLRLYPWLGEITVPDSIRDEATGRVFLDMVSARYGSHHEVAFGAAAGGPTS